MKIKFLPAFNGDCILVSFEYENRKRNILVDGGVPRTYLRHLKPELEKLIQQEENIDLLIVTHIDDDHIGGIKELYQDAALNKDFIKEVWFNSGDLLSDYFNSARESIRAVEIIKTDQTNMSVGQGVTLEKALKEEKGNWIQNLIQVSENKISFLGLSITILSPNEKTLEKLHDHWETEIDKKVTMSEEHDDFNVSISELIKRKFKEDRAVPNGSSIAILMEEGSNSILLLGDAHPTVVSDSLEKLGLATEEKKLKIDLVKVSHHASKGNTSPKLLSLIESSKFVVLTDGSKHGLPDKESIARIIASQPNCNIYFNYDDIPKEILIPEDKESYPFSFSLLSETDYSIEL
ncbi:ComEC/Rec2 family competence protein [Sphingobacterium sp. BN32]|uniref:ComEC/Rec2 family competence protein n=1 Tax=Sphingobacterium sp. BN32 TaxID=3058432 RepID=UPI00265D2151|nr:MBL fold metallo-hydrolase [Sphingobacterium sp. BN32]WKK60347.1 MBL fold metallo-hydrolase [Sphingobacterium sp. BN32]